MCRSRNVWTLGHHFRLALSDLWVDGLNKTNNLLFLQFSLSSSWDLQTVSQERGDDSSSSPQLVSPALTAVGSWRSVCSQRKVGQEVCVCVRECFTCDLQTFTSSCCVLYFTCKHCLTVNPQRVSLNFKLNTEVL